MATVAPNSLYLYRADISRDFYRNDHLRVFYRLVAAVSAAIAEDMGSGVEHIRIHSIRKL